MPAPTLGQADTPMVTQQTHYRRQFLIDMFSLILLNIEKNTTPTTKTFSLIEVGKRGKNNTRRNK